MRSHKPTLTLRGNSLKEIGLRLKNEWDDSPFPIRMMPFNRFDLEHSNIWWLTGRWLNPAYPLAKFVLGDGYPFGEVGRMFCGLHIERGFDSIIGKKNERLGTHWVWHRFLPALSSEVSDQIAQAQEMIEFPIQLHVVATPGNGGARDHVYFDIGDEFKCHVEAIGPLAGITRAANLANVECELKNLPADAGYYWIDIHIGQEIYMSPSDRDDIRNCLAMLRCFESWLAHGR